MYKKFIVNSDRIICGEVYQHRELSSDHSSTQGGGWWQKDVASKIILLYSKSLEFGPASREVLLELVKAGGHDFNGCRVFHSYSMTLEGAMKDAIELC